MKNYQLTKELIAAYGKYLQEEERNAGTIEKYLRDTKAFAAWVKGQTVTKDLAAEWKAHLLENHYARLR